MAVALLAGTAARMMSPAAAASPPAPTAPSHSSVVPHYKVAVAAEKLSWPDANATLSSLPAEAVPAAVSADSAIAAIADGLEAVTRSATPGAVPEASLYSYSNSAYGEIQPDGSVKLSFTDTPVWLVTVPLAGSLDISQGGIGFTQPKLDDCSYYYIVDATNGQFLTAGQRCADAGDTIAPTPPPEGK